MAISKQRLWIGAGIVVAWAFVLNTHRDSSPSDSATPDEPAPRCEVSVTADVLKVRSGPETDAPEIGQLGEGDVVEADDTIRNGFRQVGEGRWASEQFLLETPNSDCG